MTERPLWTLAAMAAAMKGRIAGAPSETVTGISIDSRSLQPGDAFFALSDARDGHDFVPAALQAGASVAVVAAEKANRFSNDARLLIVADVLSGLRDLAKAARTRSHAKVIGVTGSVGKTGTKETLRLALSAEGPTHASAASYNNHWGVPLSLARCPENARFAVFEMGMNHAGEIEPLTRLVRPHVAIVTAIHPVHLEHFASLDEIADAKAEIFVGLEAMGAAVLNRDSAHFDRLRQRAQEAKVGCIVSFGEHEKADARLIKCALQPASSTVQADILGTEVTYKLGAPGRHVVLNSLAVLAAVQLAGADLALAALALSDLRPPAGRGSRLHLQLHSGTALLIDESYNANPASMQAAFALLRQAPIDRNGRRIAVLGDMLELGAQAAALHRDLAGPLGDNAVDLVFCAGSAMRNLWEALPSERRGGYAEDAKGLEPAVLDAVRAGDAIMVKGSNGSKMSLIVRALERNFAPQRALEAPAQG